MTTTLTTSKGTFLFVGVPEYSNCESITEDGNIIMFDDELSPEFIYLDEPLDEFESIIISKISEIIEDQAREVVDYDGEMFAHYEDPNDFGCHTAIESVRSLMKQHKLYTVNPMGEDPIKPGTIAVSVNGVSKLKEIQMKKDWLEAQSRSFPDWLIIKLNKKPDLTNLFT